MHISPSIMCADLLRLGDSLAAIEGAGADSIHVDVMDGHFVPGFTFGGDAIRLMAAATVLPIEVHLMSDVPLKHITELADVGAAAMIVHIEATPDIVYNLAAIRAAGMAAGVAINPGTPIEALDEVLPLSDVALVMSVCPGFIGQRQMPSCVAKAGRLVERLSQRDLPHVRVMLDGGVKPENIAALAAVGVQGVVSGTGVFHPERTIAESIRLMRRNLDAASLGEAGRHVSASCT